MTFELEADGVRFWCTSPVYTRKLVEKGARLVDPDQADYLRRPNEAPPPRKGRRKRRPKSGSRP